MGGGCAAILSIFFPVQQTTRGLAEDVVAADLRKVHSRTRVQDAPETKWRRRVCDRTPSEATPPAIFRRISFAVSYTVCYRLALADPVEGKFVYVTQGAGSPASCASDGSAVAKVALLEWGLGNDLT